MASPIFWLIAGPNGAGKTTFMSTGFLRSFIPQDAMLNPDEVTRLLLEKDGIFTWEEAPAELLKTRFIEAAEQVLAEAHRRIEEGQPVVLESVLSTAKYLPLAQRVRALGGVFDLVYLVLKSPALSRARVAQRVKEGGHDVPGDKLAPRWRASLDLLPSFAIHASSFWMIDNSVEQPGDWARTMMVVQGLQVETYHHPDPQMAAIAKACADRLRELDTGHSLTFLPAKDAWIITEDGEA